VVSRLKELAAGIWSSKQWQTWAGAWMGKTNPNVTGPGLAYVLRGDKGASNTDPFATGQTPTNDWIVSPPHVMVLYQDLKMPYAHLMVPVSATKMATTAK
jgi:hypothetical protein